MEILLLFACLVVIVVIAIIRGIQSIQKNLFGPMEDWVDELGARTYRLLRRRGIL